MRTMKVLGIIPARGGSKGVPKKNIKNLNGKPLLAYTIEAGRKAKELEDLIVSTESSEISRIAKRLGAKVPFTRPKELANDTATTLSVLQHALKEYERLTGKKFTHVMLLQPTAPLRTERDIDDAVRLMAKHRSLDALISCYKGEGVHPRIMYASKNGKNALYIPASKEMTRRQDFEKVFVRNGAIYLIPRELLLKGQMIGRHPLVMEMPRWRSINIDNPDDFELARIILKYGKKN